MVTNSPSKGLFVASVLANERLCDEHHRVTVRCEAFPDARPGQFIHVLCRAPDLMDVPLGEFTWSGLQPVNLSDPCVAAPTTLIRRAFSISCLHRDATGAALELIHRVVGVGTAWLERLQVGDAVNVLGPLGNTFGIHAKHRRAYLVSGGVGLPPMIWLAKALREAGTDVVSFFGAQNRRLIPLTLPTEEQIPPDARSACEGVAEFAAYGVPVVLSTDDGSLGLPGFVTDALAAYAKANPAPADETIVYTCGPEPMMRAVAAWCRTNHIECEVCMERAMACGMGTCQSCVVPCRDASCPEGWRYRLCCTDGPVFGSREVVWD